ncbi:MAG: HEAT repeat domain-containing protein [Candidatus Xenobium sp.]|nr:HEAT repeat domain-containing protein [Burkholderiales bacterium]
MVPHLEDLVCLLILPPSEGNREEVSCWLEVAVRNLEGFRPQPSVIRRSHNVMGARAEARRWTTESFLPLTPTNPRRETLMLGSDGWLHLCRLEGQRNLRQRPNDTIVDEIYEFQRLENPTPAQLDVVRQRVLLRLFPVGYQQWDLLSTQHRQELVRFGGGWQDAGAALERCEGIERVETLQLFLDQHAAESLRQEVQHAGLQGRLRPGVDVLAWLLAQPDWNLQPGLVAMARSAVQDSPEEAWELSRHPNPQVRLRLADLFENPADWLSWLARETDDRVRDRILRVLERRYDPADLVDQLHSEKDPVRREALGWALVHWNRGITRNQDWKALNRALSSGIGRENRTRLKEKLARQGRLGLRARLLG